MLSMCNSLAQYVLENYTQLKLSQFFLLFTDAKIVFNVLYMLRSALAKLKTG